MKESYVSYEQAVKLKELGFDWECRSFYYRVTKKLVNRFGYSELSAPSLSLAQKWLREVKGIHVLPRLENVNKPDYACIITQMRKECLRIIDNDKYFQNYESALSAGISSALNLLTEKQ